MALFNLFGKLGLDATGFQAGLKKAESSAVSFGRQLKNQVSGYLTAGAFAQLTRSTVQYASHIRDMSDRLGVSTDALQEFGFAAKQTGSDIEAVTVFLEKLSASRTAALGGNRGMAEAFRQLGVTAEQLRSSRIEDIAKQIGKAFEGGDPQALVGALREIGGRGAGGLVPAMAAGLNDAAQQAHLLGQVMREDVVTALDDVGDRVDEIGTGMKNVWGSALVGVQKFVDRYVGAAHAFGQGMRQMIDHGTNGENPFKFLGEYLKQGWLGAGVDEERSAAARAARRVSTGFTPPTFTAGKGPTAASFSGIPGAGGTASSGGFFFGADAALRSVPQQQLEALKSLDARIANIERVVTEE